MKSTLTILIETFTTMLPKLIASGVLFEATEQDGEIFIKFTGSY